MRKIRIAILVTICFILVFVFVITTNYSCLERMSVEHNYQKDNGFDLIITIASIFDSWGDNVDTSNGYYISQKCINNYGDLYTDEALIKMKEASKNNIRLDNELTKASSNKTIFINQCIFLKDIKVLYITYNTFFSNNNKLIRLSLFDNIGNIIASEPSWFDNTSGLIVRNSENFFWGIDYDKYEKITLHIKVYSLEQNFLYEYDQLLY